MNLADIPVTFSEGNSTKINDIWDSKTAFAFGVSSVTNVDICA